MSIVEKIAGFLTGGVGQQVAEIINKRVPDRDLASKLQHEIEVMLAGQQHELSKLAAETERTIIAGQIEVNKLEAASGNWFASGWRPLAGYVCVLGLAYQFLLQPIVSWVSGINVWPGPPELDLGDLITLLGGMLGLGTLRTTERIKGVIPQGK
jgi:hypothetical protein